MCVVCVCLCVSVCVCVIPMINHHHFFHQYNAASIINISMHILSEMWMFCGYLRLQYANASFSTIKRISSAMWILLTCI